MRVAAVLLIVVLAPRQEIAWKSDFKAALKEAAASKKLVALLFQTPDRKDCLKFQNETLSDAGVTAALGKYICVRVNPLGTDDDNRLWQEHGSPMPPMTIIFEPDGKKLTPVAAFTAKSYGPMMGAIVPTYFERIVPAREAIARDATQPVPHKELGEAYMVLDNSRDSARHYATAAELMLNKGDKTGALALSVDQLEKYYDKKWFVPARACCSRIADLDPDNKTGKRPLAAWVLGMASCDEHRWGEAIGGLKEACEKYKDSDLLPKMKFSLASAYMYAGNIDEAIAAFDEIVAKFDGTETADIANIQSQKLKAKRDKR